MMKWLALIALTVVSASALADVDVPYGQWVDLPNCGGQTRLICPDTSYARQNNQCRIEFSNSYGCPLVNLYTNAQFYPKFKTVPEDMQARFYVDDAKINHPSLTFRIFMQNRDRSLYEKVTYKFNY